MTSLSQKNSKRFDGLRNDCTDGIKRTNEERRNAIRNGDTARADQLTDLREALRAALQDINAAEDAWLRSALSVAEAEARLIAARQDAADTIQKMLDIASTIQKAAELVGILTGLVTLFG